jgi:tRNA wybutosine-synthesizing protein 2
MGFKDNLKKILEGEISEEDLLLLPSGFQTLGKAIILKLNPKISKKKDIIGKACLELFPNIQSVYLNLGKISGEYRQPEEIKFLAGNDNPIVEHKEHDIVYKFDLTKIMFSKGNINERKFLANLVKRGEIIVDMFAGIGYFSLPIAKHSSPERIYSIEINPIAYEFLVENIKINHLESKIIPILGNSNEEVKKLSKFGIKADRVIMGVFPAPKDFIDEALELTKENGTVFHYEGVEKKENFINLFKEFNEIAQKQKFNCTLLSKRFVKSYGPGLYHIVLDILVLKM